MVVGAMSPLRRHLQADRPHPQAVPAKHLGCKPPSPLAEPPGSSKTRHARARDVSGSSKRAENCFHFLPSFVAKRDLSKGCQRLSGEIFFSALLPADRRVLRSDRPIERAVGSGMASTEPDNSAVSFRTASQSCQEIGRARRPAWCPAMGALTAIGFFERLESHCAQEQESYS